MVSRPASSYRSGVAEGDHGPEAPGELDPPKEIHLPDDIEQEDEALGTKPKFWFRGADGRRWLFKWSDRPREDGSEWIAARLARLLDVPAAEIQLARYRGRQGIASPSFLHEGQALFHGNELLAAADPTYPAHQVRRLTAYSVGRCLDTLEGYGESALDGFVGFLLLDAWVGNTDRHHENWAVIQDRRGAWLAPSFDHAASLGRTLSAQDAARRVSGHDPRVTVARYAARARSAFYPESGEATPVHPATAFGSAAARYPRAGMRWLERLASVGSGAVESVLARIPEDRWPAPHRRFAAAFLDENRRRLEAGIPSWSAAPRID